MKPRSLALTLTLSFCLACALQAQAERPSYFSPTAVDPIRLLPGPPSAGSAEAREELELMESIQHSRTKEDIDRCASEANLTIAAFKSVLGPWCTADNLPRLAKLFKALAKDSKPLVNAGKDHFKRPRPEREDAQIHVPIEDEATFAYPSGHSTRGTMYALILAELLPAHREALLQRGREIGWDRVVAGLHHPTDIYAGRVLGQALAESLLADPKFQNEFVQLKKELSEAEQHAAEQHAAEVGAKR
jgi:acid phosphatase (class A)